jgi:hypothetical protein
MHACTVQQKFKRHTEKASEEEEAIRMNLRK